MNFKGRLEDRRVASGAMSKEIMRLNMAIIGPTLNSIPTNPILPSLHTRSRGQPGLRSGGHWPTPVDLCWESEKRSGDQSGVRSNFSRPSRDILPKNVLSFAHLTASPPSWALMAAGIMRQTQTQETGGSDSIHQSMRCEYPGAVRLRSNGSAPRNGRRMLQGVRGEQGAASD